MIGFECLCYHIQADRIFNNHFDTPFNIMFISCAFVSAFFLFCSIFVLNNYDNWSVPHKYHILDTSWVADSTQQFRHRHTKNRIYKDSHISISYLYVFDLFIRFEKRNNNHLRFEFDMVFFFFRIFIRLCHYLLLSFFSLSFRLSLHLSLYFLFNRSLICVFFFTFWSAAN